VTATHRLAIALACVVSAPHVVAAQDVPPAIRQAAACAPLPLTAPDGAPRVIGGQDPSPKTLYGTRDRVVIGAGTGRGIQVGQQFFVRRAMAGSGGPAPRAEDTAGWLTIVAVNEQSAIATIDFACDGVVVGDHLEAYAAPTLPPNIDRTDASGELDFSVVARVLTGSNARMTGATGDFMIADKGESEGVRPGTRLAIYRDVYGSSQIPTVVVGEAVVVFATAEQSVIRLTQTRDGVLASDLLVTRKPGRMAAAPAAALPPPQQVGSGEGGIATTSPAPQPRQPMRDYSFEDVHFDFDRHTLRPEALAILDEAIAALQKDPTLRLQIEGHTCNIGTAEYNLALGALRAQAVSDYLTSRGVAESRLSAVSYGEERPKHDNAREETRSLNRRAVLVVNLQP
jgi:outer membrane protein OmpA-like peptidoglycan-associated protein